MTQTSTVLHAPHTEFAPFLAQQAAPPRGIETGESSTVQPGGAQPVGPAPGGKPQNPNGMLFMFAPLLLLFVVMMFLSSRTQKKQKRQQEDMLSSLTRHDRVETIGGIIGTIAEMRDSEVVIKVDEATNTKIHVSRSAIKGVLKQARRENADSASDA